MASQQADWYEPLLPYLPDAVTRRGIRRLVHQRLVDETGTGSWEQQSARKQAFVQELLQSEIAVHTKDANQQHYEVPSEFYKLVLGKNLKYSCCLYPSAASSLDEAEDAMLASYIEKAQLQDGQDVLDLGCGWGSLSLFLAARFPRSRITGLSNSATQRAYILETAKQRGLTNLSIETGDVSVFDFPSSQPRFDRVVSIEMFEHMKNYQRLLAKVSSWLKPGGKLFVRITRPKEEKTCGRERLTEPDIFCHKQFAYHFETEGSNNWMARNFFTGGTMPSADLLLFFQRDLSLVNRWVVNGTHYARTSEDWLKRMDANHAAIRTIFAKTYGEANAARWVCMWRLFFLAVAEMFNYAQGNEWGVGLYLFEKREASKQ